jgi:hypothetical protein
MIATIYFLLLIPLLLIGVCYLLVDSWLENRKMKRYAKQYGQLKSQAEKGRFLAETFGRYGMDYVEEMERMSK